MLRLPNEWLRYTNDHQTLLAAPTISNLQIGERSHVDINQILLLVSHTYPGEAASQTPLLFQILCR